MNIKVFSFYTITAFKNKSILIFKVEFPVNDTAEEINDWFFCIWWNTKIVYAKFRNNRNYLQKLYWGRALIV